MPVAPDTMVLTETRHDPPPAIEPFENEREVVFVGAVNTGVLDALQFECVAVAADWTCMVPGEAGKMSVNVTWLTTSFGFGFVIMNVSLEEPPGGTGFVENIFVMLGGDNAVSEALATPVVLVFVPLWDE